MKLATLVLLLAGFIISTPALALTAATFNSDGTWASSDLDKEGNLSTSYSNATWSHIQLDQYGRPLGMHHSNGVWTETRVHRYGDKATTYHSNGTWTHTYIRQHPSSPQASVP